MRFLKIHVEYGRFFQLDTIAYDKDECEECISLKEGDKSPDSLGHIEYYNDNDSGFLYDYKEYGFDYAIRNARLIHNHVCEIGHCYVCGKYCHITWTNKCVECTDKNLDTCRICGNIIYNKTYSLKTCNDKLCIDIRHFTSHSFEGVKAVQLYIKYGYKRQIKKREELGRCQQLKMRHRLRGQAEGFATPFSMRSTHLGMGQATPQGQGQWR